MAGAYKGLTIRIGADSTKLSSALRSANSAIYKTQSELNKLTKALKLDPGNQNAASLQMGRLSEQTTNVAKQIENLKAGIKEFGNLTAKHLDVDTGKLVDGENIAELANNTKSVTYEAEAWKKTYTEVDGELGKIYKNIKALTDVDLAKATRDGFGDEFEAELENAMNIAAEKGQPIDALADKIHELKPAWMQAKAEMDNYADAAKLDSLTDDLALQESKIKAVAHQYAEMASKSNISKTTQDLADRTQLVGKAADDASQRFRRLDEAAKLNPNSIGTAADRAKALGEAMHATHEKARSLKEQLDAYRADGIDRIAASTKDSALRFQEAKENVARLKAELETEIAKSGEASDKAQELGKALDAAMKELDTASAVHEYQELETQMRETQATSKSMGGALQADLGEIGAAAVNAAIEIGNLLGQAGSKIVEASSEIDSAYRDMRKTVNGTEQQYQDLYDAAIKYSQAHVTSADQMLEMEAIAGQVGITADALQNFAETAADLDVATDIDAESIALQMGQISNVMSDLDENNVRSFADALVRLGNNMPAQESAIMNIAQRMSSVANITSMSTPDVLAWSAAIASTGARSEMASTAISNTMMAIESAVAAGGEDLKAFAEIAGVSAKEFADQWENNPTDALKGFIEGLKNLEDSDESAIAALEKMGISGVRQKTTLLALTSTLDKLDDALEMSGNAWSGVSDEWGDAGDAAREAEKKAEGFSGSLAKMKNSAQVLASTLGEALAPYIDMAAELLQRLTEFINSLDSDTKSAAVGVGTLMAAFATGYPILAALGRPLVDLAKNMRTFAVDGIGTAISKVGDFGAAVSLFARGDVATLGEAFATGESSVGLFGSALSGLLTPLGMTVGAVGVLAAAVGASYAVKAYKAKKYTDDFNAAVSNIKGVTSDLAVELYNASDAIDGYAEKWSAARVDMESYHKSLKEHTDAQLEARDSMIESVGALERYQSIIDNAAGKGERFAGNMGELQWAIDKVNEATGESYTANDVLEGKYLDESGAIKNTRDEIDKLIEARKRDAQIAGYEQILSENIAAQEKNRIARETAANAYQDYIDMKLDSGAREARAETKGMSDTQYIKWLQENDEYTQQLMLDSKNLRYENQLLKESYDETSQALGGLVDRSTYATSMNMGERETVVRLSESFKDAASTLGWTNDQFAEFAKTYSIRMRDCGVSTEQFAKSDLNELATKMVETNGDVNTMLQSMLEYAALEFPDKYANVYLDENGDLRSKIDDMRVTWDESAGDWAPVKLDADTTQLEAAEQEARQAVEGGDAANITVGADTSKADSDIEQAKANAEGDSVEVDASANTEQMESDIQEGAQAATEAASESATVQANVEMDTSNADTSNLNEILGLEGKSIDIAVNITANAEGASEALEALDNLPSSKDIKVNIAVPGIASKARSIATLNAAAEKMKSASHTYKASGSATTKTPYSNIKSLNSAANSMKSKSATYTANGNAASGSAASHVWDLVSATRNMYSKSVTLTTNQVTKKRTVTLPGSSATGAYVPYNKIPKHAAGIFTQPTLTNIGWVGEDGAELYSGNSLVPLTNRKYSMPYINDISDAVARKLDFGGGEKSITLYVSCEGGPNETASAIVRALEHANI